MLNILIWYLHMQDNVLHGSFLAELTKEVLSDLEASKYQHAEYRISIYGRKRVEWDILAAWIVQNSLCSDNVVWLIQVQMLPASLGASCQAWSSTCLGPCIGSRHLYHILDLTRTPRREPSHSMWLIWLNLYCLHRGH